MKLRLLSLLLLSLTVFAGGCAEEETDVRYAGAYRRVAPNDPGLDPTQAKVEDYFLIYKSGVVENAALGILWNIDKNGNGVVSQNGVKVSYTQVRPNRLAVSFSDGTTTQVSYHLVLTTEKEYALQKAKGPMSNDQNKRSPSQFSNLAD